ncbi:MAG: GNAT family N-acetyltransferase [Lachnospiraceae bacterium]|nr:GNAT family N-acetyltransferase [Lachnospiraceae bacterium]
METVIYDGIPDYAKKIRQKVFVDEQGFNDEFDYIDETVAHIVMFDENKKPIGTCRIFWDAEMNTYILGRLAVIKEYRGKNIGSDIVKEAEKYVEKNGGQSIALHAQCRASAFYQKSGFTEFGDIDDVEGCPHIWMKKNLKI